MSKKNERVEGKRCSRMPGERFNSLTAAEEMRVTRQVNTAIGGMGQVVYHVKKCGCGGFHVLTEAHLRNWEAQRRATRRERGRNA